MSKKRTIDEYRQVKDSVYNPPQSHYDDRLNKEEQYQQLISFPYVDRDMLMSIMSTIPEETKDMVKLMFKDQFGMVEFKGNIISSIKRDRLAHSLD